MSVMHISRRLVGGVALVFLIGSGAGLAQAPKRTTHAKPTAVETSFTNGDVVKLIRAGMSDAIVIAKIDRAPKERLDISTDALVRLKEAGASQPVIEAVMRRAGNPPANGGAASTVAPRSETTPPPLAQSPAAAPTGPANVPSGPVSLFSGSRWAPLVSLVGKPRKKLLVHYVDFDGRGALVRTGTSNPKVQIRSTSDVRGTYYLVRLEVLENKGARTLKYGGKERDPNEDFAVATDVQKAADGSWLLAPTGPLKPGEYGVFTSRAPDRPGAPDSIVIYEFGIDERSSSNEVVATTGALAAPAAAVPPKAPAATPRSETPSPQAPATSAMAACQQAFKAEGGYWKGAAFQTSFAIPPGKEAVVFETLMQALAGSHANWQNLSLSKEAGLITAVEDMAEIMGHKTLRAPLKIVVKKGPDGAAKTVEMLFQVPSGTKAPESGVKKVLCDEIAASLDSPKG